VSVAGNPPLERTSLEEWRAQLDVNATGAFFARVLRCPGCSNAAAAPEAGTINEQTLILGRGIQT
jgi:hypothetical protein